MVLVRFQVHPRGLSLAMQRKVHLCRMVHKKPFEKIASQVRNLKGKILCTETIRDVFHSGA